MPAQDKPICVCGPCRGLDGPKFEIRFRPAFGPCLPNPYYFVSDHTLDFCFLVVLVLSQKKSGPYGPALG
jgi:hypothetical protein